MIILDTTVLVYAVGTEHPFRDPCRTLLGGIAEGAIAATTTPEVLQEFAHVRSRRSGRSQAADDTRSWLELLKPLTPFEAHHVRDGLQLFCQYEALGAFGAMLAAVCLASPSATLVSADGAFGAVKGLRSVIPTQDTVRRLLGHPET